MIPGGSGHWLSDANTTSKRHKLPNVGAAAVDAAAPNAGADDNADPKLKPATSKAHDISKVDVGNRHSSTMLFRLDVQHDNFWKIKHRIMKHDG